MTTMSPPISPPGPDTRPRAQTAMSFSSQRSHRSSSSGNKLDLTETARDKRRLNTKADPSKALNEATPAEQAQEESTVDDLRRATHRDTEGNPITDPDRSNPTRHRMERPLDTIRAFNAAAEGTSYRRASYHSRSGSQVGWNGDMNRRASYYSNNAMSPQRPRPSPSTGYYRNSSYGFGPQNAVEEEPGAGQMYHGRSPRQHSNPYPGYQTAHQYGHQNGYQNGHGPNESPVSAHSYQQSYETMTSGSDDYGKSTNPSSQNSSFDQLHQLRKPDELSPENPYANEINFNQVTPAKAFSPYYGAPAGQGQAGGPSPPAREYVPNNPRQLIKLSTGQNEAPYGGSPQSPPPAKRQSWIKRRFSRRES